MADDRDINFPIFVELWISPCACRQLPFHGNIYKHMSHALERKHCISRVAPPFFLKKKKKKVISYGVYCVYVCVCVCVCVCVYSYGQNICSCALCDKKDRPKLKTLSGIRNASSIAQTNSAAVLPHQHVSAAH